MVADNALRKYTWAEIHAANQEAQNKTVSVRMRADMGFYPVCVACVAGK